MKIDTCSLKMLFCFKVVDTNSHVLYKKQDAIKGKFAFTTDDYDMFEVCFESEGKRLVSNKNYLRTLLKIFFSELIVYMFFITL